MARQCIQPHLAAECELLNAPCLHEMETTRLSVSSDNIPTCLIRSSCSPETRTFPLRIISYGDRYHPWIRRHLSHWLFSFPFIPDGVRKLELLLEQAIAVSTVTIATWPLIRCI